MVAGSEGRRDITHKNPRPQPEPLAAITLDHTQSSMAECDSALITGVHVAQCACTAGMAHCPDHPMHCPTWPCTAHPIPCTALPIPCTALPIPCTALLIPCTALPIPCTALPIPCTAHPIPCTALPGHAADQSREDEAEVGETLMWLNADEHRHRPERAGGRGGRGGRHNCRFTRMSRHVWWGRRIARGGEGNGVAAVRCALAQAH